MDLGVITTDTSVARSVRYQLTSGGELMTWRDVLTNWSESDTFVDFYSDVLRASSFDAFRWETPRLTEAGLDDDLEFVLVESNGLVGRLDPTAFDEHFRSGDSVVTFSNLGGDCVLVVPRPSGPEVDFGHLAAFLRSGSNEQIRNFWRATSAAVTERVKAGPLWLSTAGAGVAWLHVRLDDRPKYYSYAPYRNAV